MKKIIFTLMFGVVLASCTSTPAKDIEPCFNDSIPSDSIIIDSVTVDSIVDSTIVDTL